MPMSEYKYFVARAEAVAEKIISFVSLLNEVFPHSGMTDEFYRWKHLDNPYGSSIIGWCENATGNVVGFRALWSQGLVCGGKSYLAYQPCDTATKKESRGSGVSSRLVDLCMQHAVKMGGSAIFNFPNENSLPLYLKLNWSVQRGVRRYVRITDAIDILRQYRDVREKFKPNIKTSIREAIDFRGFVYLPDDLAVSARVDEEVLDWRFNRHPRFIYCAVRLPSNEVAVFREGHRGKIIEAEVVFVSSRRSGVLRGVSNALTSTHPVDCISLVANGRFPVLAGFIPVPSSINFVKRSISAEFGNAPFDLQPMQIDVT